MRVLPLAVLISGLTVMSAWSAPSANRFDLVCRDPLNPQRAETRLSIDLDARRWCRTGHCKPYRRWKIARISGRQVMLREERGTRIVYNRRTGEYFHWTANGKRTERRWSCKEEAFTPF